MNEQRGFVALSSATIAADGTRSPDLLPQLDLSVSMRILGDFEIVLATTEKPGEDAAAERRELHINPILLSLVPDVIHLVGRSHHHGSYTLTMTFSDGRATAKQWRTTFDVPLADSTWHLTVPFDIRRNT